MQAKSFSQVGFMEQLQTRHDLLRRTKAEGAPGMNRGDEENPYRTIVIADA
jgi:hypothetical protein